MRSKTTKIKKNSLKKHLRLSAFLKKLNYLHIIIAILFLFIIYLCIDSFNKTKIINNLLLINKNLYINDEIEEHYNSEKNKVSDYIKDYKTDVLVIGGSNSGLISAISAAENGAKVIVAESDSSAGEELADSYFSYNSPDRELQKNIKTNSYFDDLITKVVSVDAINDEHFKLKNKAGTEMYISRINGDNSLYDSSEWFTLQVWDASDYKLKLPLVKTLCFNSYDGYLWLKKLGIEFASYVDDSDNSLWPRKHILKNKNQNDLLSTYIKYIDENNNSNILYNSLCEGLIYDKGKLIGANFINSNGKRFKVNADCIIFADNILNSFFDSATINTDAQVLDSNGVPIDRLYACGHFLKCIHEDKLIDGNALVEDVVFGRIAGKSAAINSSK